MKIEQYEIRVELYVGGVSKSKQYFYYSDANKMNEEIKSLLAFAKDSNNDLYIDEYKELGNRTILSIPSLSNETHYFIVAKTKQVNFNESIKL
jgi:hypothetical protein